MTQHSLPLYDDYRVSRVQISELTHSNWTWCQVSGLQTIEIKSKSYKYVDYAFCELGLADKKILIVHVFRYLHDQDFTFNGIYQVGIKCFIGRRTADEKSKRSQIRIVPIMDDSNQIKGGKILIGEESFAFLSCNDDNDKAFREDMTETWLKEIRIGGKIGWIQVEVELSRLNVE